MKPAISDPVSFRLEAAYQRVCAVCLKPTPFDPHHVIEKQWLKKRSLPQYDTRNALRLCKLGMANNCHGQHTNAMRRVKTTELRDCNIEYAFEVMGAAAGDYLRRYYDDSAQDPRVEREFRARLDAA